jgi:hypothetical protein
LQVSFQVLKQDEGDTMQADKYETIRRRAYEIWERNGRPEGRDDAHWREAEAELAAAGDLGNEGEGNKTAALAFDHAQTEFAQSPGSEKLGEAAREALQGSEGADLKSAEEQARSHSRGEDPALAKKRGAAQGA